MDRVTKAAVAISGSKFPSKNSFEKARATIKARTAMMEEITPPLISIVFGLMVCGLLLWGAYG